jgi:putative FmdB family regulatory protein
MPIYEYACRTCGERFELLVRGEMTPACPSCKSESLERITSLPRVRSDTTRNLAARAAKKRDAAQARDNRHEQLKYEQSHDRHG